ncbi:MAG TPA: hypothetical protein ENK76_00025 [Campylobacterales bacterium]|nr:hypothetical protein [Campylobacterales bacterium]
MNTKTHKLFYIFSIVILLFIIEILYLYQTKSITPQQKIKKEQFVSLSGLPDLAIVTESFAIRHRTLSDLFSIYSDDPTLREYFPSSFAYSHSHIINQEITIEK